jgi:hypothetical protein
MFPCLHVEVLTSVLLLCRAYTSTSNDAAATTVAFVQGRFETATSLDRLMAYTPCNTFGSLFVCSGHGVAVATMTMVWTFFVTTCGTIFLFWARR